MKICNHVYQIKIDFNITENIKRYVYVYLITGKSCCLIDSGVAGSEYIIEEYMFRIGRNLKEIDKIFLTHSHPDHMGSAAAIQKLSDCSIIAGTAEKTWMEDIKCQFRERPIPNFYNLCDRSIKIDAFAETGRIFEVGEGMTIEAIETPGHSPGSISYILRDVHQSGAAFIGDAVPVPGDIPIFTNPLQSINSIRELIQLSEVQWYCPAWDKVYDVETFARASEDGIALIEKIFKTARQVCDVYFDRSSEEKVKYICQKLGVKMDTVNPLFMRSILSCLSG